MIELDKIYNEDCLQGMKRIDTASVDCIICDPPYLLENQGGGFWSKNEDPTVNHYNARCTRKGMDRLGSIKDGFSDRRGMPLGRGTAPVKEVYRKAKEMDIPMVVESETLTPDGVTEAEICFAYLKELEAGN